MATFDKLGQEAINDILGIMSEEDQKRFLATIELARRDSEPFTYAWDSEWSYPDGSNSLAMTTLLGNLDGPSYHFTVEKDGVWAYVSGKWGSGWFSVNISDPLNSGTTAWFVQE